MVKNISIEYVTYKIIYYLKKDMDNFNQYKGNYCNIWRCYHDPSIETSTTTNDPRTTIINYYSKAAYDGWCINQLELYINEVCCILYPYMNNIHSDYVGFQHYRRAFDTTHLEDFSVLDNKVEFFHVAPWFKIRRHLKSVWYLTDTMYMAVLDFLHQEYKELIMSQRDKDFFIRRNIFFTSWSQYERIAEFYLGLINFIADEFNLGYDPNKWYSSIYREYILNNIGRYMWWTWSIIDEDPGLTHPFAYRIWSYVLECLGGQYIQTYHDTVCYGDYNFDPTRQQEDKS